MKLIRNFVSFIICTVVISNVAYAATDVDMNTKWDLSATQDKYIQQTVLQSKIKLAQEEANKPAKGEKVVEIAKQYLGIPYVWGGTSPNGFDCSGLVQYVYNQIGISLSRTTDTQVNEGRYISKDDLEIGDLVFFKKNGEIHHVGIYIGKNKYIHAPQTGDVVKISNISERADYYTARRIAE